MMTVLLGVLAFGVALYVLWPLVLGSRTYRARKSTTEELMERRDVLLQELRDLDVDREAGKMDPETYAEVRARLERELAEVLALLELQGER